MNSQELVNTVDISSDQQKYHKILDSINRGNEDAILNSVEDEELATQLRKLVAEVKKNKVLRSNFVWLKGKRIHLLKKEEKVKIVKHHFKVSVKDINKVFGFFVELLREKYYSKS